ncbi:two-component system response regulator ArlR [Dysgonomonas sp. PFB1-18]|uniref:response regulator transcription factor n=1 Tax=unclassified Dysgonomonas TaxID=2630389 RepID=UPI0024751D86|nr:MULTISPECIES: response regulator transcription factor [unclassified Dysgonomonas]MDL2303049.1 response regulator transcription factor [Dysgonomonas sp. OttesenSCG-928-D17]MDH6310142.1 two-component system response regulator ArlR [Dysgonomonas sp. PF1-14]MDH6340192.1 two-component system response regulator ArlR [Dysgonomonas sp. PF1-16]MDH6381699.1 two-component system response regulator ArlR [Dysgonomonas sp. PFB1-18]MDH6399058.1 two-component system response regulator ArlR [Dysgonomonas sp
MQHILIIEDEPGIYNFLKQGLEEEGYSITIAIDGKHGLELSMSENPDLILLDWMLPKMTGIEVCKAIREKDPEVPILFLTAKDTVQETIEGLQSGANDYIKKPFSFEELLERIKIHFRNYKSKSNLTLGNISLNVKTYEVKIDSLDIPFTQREFELLEFLIRNKGNVCKRDEIIEKVWGISFEYDTGVIDVFINAIRKKLNLDKDNGYIRTIRGVGYIASE